MSASKDKSQRFTFVYKNFYKAYKDSQKKTEDAKKGVLLNIAPGANPSVVEAPADRAAERPVESMKLETQPIEKTVEKSVESKGLSQNLIDEITKKPYFGSGSVLKAKDKVSNHTIKSAQISQYREPEILGKRVESKQLKRDLERKNESLRVGFEMRPLTQNNATLTDLKKNLNELKDLHKRLRFMLGELEGLIED